jgi:hypothetical protein
LQLQLLQIFVMHACCCCCCHHSSPPPSPSRPAMSPADMQKAGYRMVFLQASSSTKQQQQQQQREIAASLCCQVRKHAVACMQWGHLQQTPTTTLPHISSCSPLAVAPDCLQMKMFNGSAQLHCQPQPNLWFHLRSPACFRPRQRVTTTHLASVIHIHGQQPCSKDV